MGQRVKGGSEARDNLEYHGVTVLGTSRVERQRALFPGRGKELDEASSYPWHTPKSAAALSPRVPGSQQTHKGEVLKLRLEWSTNWTPSLMQHPSKLSHTDMPATYLSSYFNQGLDILPTPPPQGYLSSKLRESRVVCGANASP